MTAFASVPVPSSLPPTAPVALPALMLQPMVHVTDMAASIEFYEHLGGSIIHGSPDAEWVLMQVGTSQIGLLVQPPSREHGEGAVELNFHCPMPLERLEDQLRGSGLVLTVADDVTFGRQLVVRGPNGMIAKINEVEPDLLV